MKISEHFDSKEFACRCGKCEYDGTGMKWLLVSYLEKLREAVGCPLTVNRGHSCPEHNAKVGGVPNSFHIKGSAADITCTGASLDELARKASEIFNLGGVGFYPEEGFVHVDVRGVRARWTKRAAGYSAWELS